MPTLQKITPFLWYDTEAELAATFYVSLFPDSRILGLSRYGDGGPRPKGLVMTVTFELAGLRLIALNGGPQYQFTDAFSLAVNCESQAEVDRLWTQLLEGGRPSACGW